MENEIKNKLVLLIDDDLSLLKILKDKLNEVNINSISATDAQVALNLTKAKHPNLILLDIMLPGGINGFDFLEQIKLDKSLESIPIIVLTNLDSEQKTALEIGAVDYIVKPHLSIDQVILKIKNHLK